MANRDPSKQLPRQPPAGLARVNSRRATAAAVLGSVAALGGAGSAVAQTTGHPPRSDLQRRQSRRVDTLPPGERVLLTEVFSTLSAQAPAIARPILATGVSDGTITQAQEDAFLARLASVKAAEGGSGPTAGAGSVAAPAEAPPPPPSPGPAGQAVFQRALAAIRAELPLIALPLLGAAIAAGSISEAQATRLRARFEQGPRLGFGLVMRGARAAGATRLP